MVAPGRKWEYKSLTPVNIDEKAKMDVADFVPQYAMRYPRAAPQGETPEERKKRLEKEKSEKEAAERKRGRSLLTGYTPPNVRRRTLLGGTDNPLTA